MELKRNIDQKLRRTESLLDRPAIDSEVQHEAEEEMRDIYREIVALQSEKAFKNHMAKYISEARKERQEGEREALCTCSRPTCSLTQGKIPPQVKTRGSELLRTRSTWDLVSEFVQDHDGAEVMHDLLEEWEQREGDLYRNLSQIHARLEREEPLPPNAAKIAKAANE